MYPVRQLLATTLACHKRTVGTKRTLSAVENATDLACANTEVSMLTELGRGAMLWASWADTGPGATRPTHLRAGLGLPKNKNAETHASGGAGSRHGKQAGKQADEEATTKYILHTPC